MCLIASPMKNWLWIAVAALALVFTGERLTLNRATPNLLRFAHTFTTESERVIIDAVVAEFEQAHPGVRIEQTISNSETYNTIGWRLQFQGRKQPDLYFHWQGFKTGQCIERGWAMDLTPFLSPGFTEQFVSSTFRPQHGGCYFLPQSVDLSALVWYNRDLFDHLGLKEPRSFNEWIALCLRLRLAKILPLAQGNRDLWPMGNFAAEVMGQAEGPDAMAELFQSKTSIRSEDLRGLKNLTALQQAGAFDLPGVLERGAIGSLHDIDAKVFFLSGKSAQHIVGSWFVADVQDARSKGELKFSVGVFPVPPGEGERDALCAVTTGYLVNPATKNPRAAVSFLELLLSRKYQAEFAKLGNLSARRDAVEFTSDPLAERMVQILGTTALIVPPPDTGYRPEQAAVFYATVGKLLAGKLEWALAAEYWGKEKQGLSRKGL
jgi:raffinose/stachyose/melibiose transport system substrate-binding protein